MSQDLETVEEYIRGFRGVYGQHLSYWLRDDLISPVAKSDPTYRANISNYFAHYEWMIAQGSVLSGPAVLGTYTEEIVPFTESSITYRALIWEIWLKYSIDWTHGRTSS